MKKIVLLLIALLSVNSFFAQEITTELIEINYSDGSYPKSLTKGNGKIFFSATDEWMERNLWVHDEVTLETYKLETGFTGTNTDIENGNFKMVGDLLYFTKVTSVTENILCKTDGTQQGTQLVKVLINNNWQENAAINNLTSYNGNLYFTALDNINGNELWVSDGTEAGTHVLKDVNPGTASSNISSIFEFNGFLYFAATNSVSGTEFWKSDGTEEGTVILKDIYAGNRNGITPAIGPNTIAFNSHFYFFANNGTNGTELWSSDGTTEGTQLFKEFGAGTSGVVLPLSGIAVENNYFIFMASTSSAQQQLWKSDGTIVGTTILKSINQSVDGFVTFSQFTVLNSVPYFVGKEWWAGSKLWTTNGTISGTNEIVDIINSSDGNIIDLTAADNYLIFSTGSTSQKRPWVSDGTAAGTRQLANFTLNNSSAGETKFVPSGNIVYFQASADELSGMELWSTDGNNTTIVKDLYHRYSGVISGGVYSAETLNEKVIFMGNNGVNGQEPFISDGTHEGTTLLKDIHEGNYGSIGFTNESNTNIFIKAGNKLFFNANDGVTGKEIYCTDGTTAGTVLVKDIAQGRTNSVAEYTYFMVYNGIFYFKANDNIHGSELWRSDGTEAGTYMLKDINPGAASGVTASNSYTYTNINYAILNGFLYFLARDASGFGVWRTDGTEAGTGRAISVPSSNGTNSELVIFGATDDKIFLASNTLWSSDGTQNGTQPIYNFSGSVAQNRTVAILNNEFYYFTSDANSGYSIFKTTGMTGNNQLVKGYLNVDGSYSFNFMKQCGDYIYFGMGNGSATDSANELWRTDGTMEGTILLSSMELNPSFYGMSGFTCYDNNLFYIQPEDDDFLWITDGNVENTLPISVTVTNAPQLGEWRGLNGILGIINNKIYFSGFTQEGGNELYVSNADDILKNTPIKDISKNNFNSVLLYPNPGSSIVTVSNLKNNIIDNVIIYDLTGKKVYETKGGSTAVSFSVSALLKGIYLIKVSTDDGVITKKLIRS